MSIARHEPLARRFRVISTGAANTRLVVVIAAAEAGESDTIRPRSSRSVPACLIPAAAALNLYPGIGGSFLFNLVYSPISGTFTPRL